MRRSSSRGAMYKILPTFRAGGVASRPPSQRADEGRNHKTALARSYFSNDHFSSPLADMEDPMLKRTRVTVRVMEAKDLLVSDLPTGTSDPVALLWVGSAEEGDIDLRKDQRVQSTEVRQHTVDPVWDAEFAFPLDIQSVEDVMSGRVNILVRDFDDADGDVHFLDLGQVSVSLETVLTEGNIMAHTQLVQLPARWYKLQRCRGMRKSSGALKIAVGFFVGADSALLQGDDSSGSIDQDAGVAGHFEHNMKKLRREQEVNGLGRTVSMSPIRRSPATSRTLTARGGTTQIRPKSAPEPTTLKSPTRGRHRPFELKALQPLFPPADVHKVATTQPDPSGWVAAETSNVRATETVTNEQRPRWRDTFGTPEGQNDTTPAPLPWRSARNTACLKEGQPPAKWTVDSPPKAQLVRSSNKLSRLAAKAARRPTDQQSPIVTASWDGDDGATVRAHRWHRRLLESMQRLEDRSTEGLAYGELRGMVRAASSAQVGQVVVAARRVGATCSVASRRLTLRLLAWLCWDQPRAARKVCGSIVAYALDRIRDDETASLRDDLAVCIGAVMLSALRNSTADACMAQVRRFLELVREQRVSVRESAGACCAAAVLPNPPLVPVEIETGLRSIDDVRLAIGQAAGRAGIATPVPKEAVLLPGGLAVVELANAPAAAEFFDRVSMAAEGFPPAWSFSPFPEGFCSDIKRAEAAHFARLAVNSEDILALLLEALDSNRSEGTRAQLLNAIAAMARSRANHENDLETPNEISTATGCTGLSATLLKGLPAVARAIVAVMNCPVRRTFTWKERQAAMEVVVAFAVLQDLRGPEGPLGEHRAKQIQASMVGKRDSVGAVREAAARSLAALEATEAEEGRRDKTQGIASSGLGFLGAGVRRGAGTTDAKTKTSYRAEATGDSKFPHKKKTLAGLMVNAEMATTKDVADAAEHHAEERARHGRQDHQAMPDHKAGQDDTLTPQDVSPAHPVSSATSTKDLSRSSNDSQQEKPPLLINFTPLSPTEELWSAEESNRVRTPDQPIPEHPERPRTADTGTKSRVEDGDVDGAPPELQDGRHGSGRETPPATGAVAPVEPKVNDGTIRPPRQDITSEGKHAYTQAVVVSDSQPLDTMSLPVERPVHVSLQAKASHTERNVVVPSLGVGSAEMVAPSLVPPPMRERLQVDTVRLLRRLNDKTDGIADVLHSLDQRLGGKKNNIVPRYLQERPNIADSRSSPVSRKLKRQRSGRTAPLETTAAPREKPKSEKEATRSTTAAATGARSARATTRVRRDIGVLIQREDVEGAFQLALRSGSERDVLRLMGSTGGPDLCRRRLGMETRDRLFVFVARMISAGLYAEHVLPWVFELVRAGEARVLPLAVRMQLAGALHGLAASPTDQGIMAAKLGPYMSLLSVGRASLADATEGGGVFSSMAVDGGTA